MRYEDLWQLCFAPDDGAVFFENSFSPERAYDNMGVSMLHWTEIDISGKPFAYALGICTHPDRRGLGLASVLVERFISEHPQCCLLPQNPGLAAFYERFGFKQTGILQRLTHLPPAKPANETDFKEINALYEQAVRDVPHVIRSEKDWRIISKLYRVEFGGEFYGVYDEDILMESSRHEGYAPSPMAACVKTNSDFHPYINLLYNGVMENGSHITV